MYRSMMQVYVKGSNKAVEFYQKAFDAELVVSYPNEDGTFMHAELDVYGQILALSEANDDTVIGNNMQFCLHFGKGNAEMVYKIYEILKEGALPHEPIGDSGFSQHCFWLVDKFRVYWCVFE